MKPLKYQGIKPCQWHWACGHKSATSTHQPCRLNCRVKEGYVNLYNLKSSVKTASVQFWNWLKQGTTIYLLFILSGRYFDEISQDTGKYCFGVDDSLKGLEMGAVDTLIVWENLDITRYVLKNHSTDGMLLIIY